MTNVKMFPEKEKKEFDFRWKVTEFLSCFSLIKHTSSQCDARGIQTLITRPDQIEGKRHVCKY